MQARIPEQEEIDKYITRLLSDLSKATAMRLKAGLRILMTTDQTTFRTICSSAVQQELQDFVDLLQHPEAIAPKTSSTEQGATTIIEYIKKFTLEHLNLLDARSTILPSVANVTKNLTEGGHLKSVVHTSAIRNVVKAAHFVDALEKKFKSEGLQGHLLDDAVKRAAMGTARLHNFVLVGDILALERELATPGVDVNLPNPDGLPLLHIAVREGFLQIVETLLKIPGIQVNLVSNSGWTPLHLAARLGDSDIVAALLRAPGIDVNIANSDGWTALHWAAWHGNSEIVIQLLDVPGIEVNPRDKNKTTPLHWAARNGQVDVISILLDARGIEVNPADSDLKTPLYYAVNFDHTAATAALVADPRLEVNLQDIDGLSALHWAARNGRLDLVNLLLEVPGIRKDLLDNNNMTPYDWAKKLEFPELLPFLSIHPLKHTWLQKLKEIWRNIADYFRTHLTTEP